MRPLYDCIKKDKKKMNIEEAIKILKLSKKTFICGTKQTIVEMEAIDTVLNELEKKDKVIDEIQEEVSSHIGFENRLKRDNEEPDLFNQGRFYVANNIKNILRK